MLSRSIPCLWITFYLYLSSHVYSGEAQNAKEGKFLKFGLSIPPRSRQHPEWSGMCSKPADTVTTFCRIFSQIPVFIKLSLDMNASVLCSRLFSDLAVFLRTAGRHRRKHIRGWRSCFYVIQRHYVINRLSPLSVWYKWLDQQAGSECAVRQRAASGAYFLQSGLRSNSLSSLVSWKENPSDWNGYLICHWLSGWPESW